MLFMYMVGILFGSCKKKKKETLLQEMSASAKRNENEREWTELFLKYMIFIMHDKRMPNDSFSSSVVIVVSCLIGNNRSPGLITIPSKGKTSTNTS